MSEVGKAMSGADPGHNRVLRVEIEIALEASTAFDLLLEELSVALEEIGLTFMPGEDGRLTDRGAEVGTVESWMPGEEIRLQWRPSDWQEGAAPAMGMRFEPVRDGTRVRLEVGGYEGSVGDADEVVGWLAGQVLLPLLRSISPAALGDWVTDRRARRPSGSQSRAVYRDPIYHYPLFRVILTELEPSASDYLLEVGCGGGALLKDALQSGCRAAAIDHSPDMVRLARETNSVAVAAGHLEVRHASADRLPFPDETFTCAAMTGVLGFLPDPVRALAEIRRVLTSNGRLVVAGSDPELKGTPGAPDPMASRLRFYDDDALLKLARDAGFDEARVVRRNLEPFAREAGIPEEHLPLFADAPARFLMAGT